MSDLDCFLLMLYRAEPSCHYLTYAHEDSNQLTVGALRSPQLLMEMSVFLLAGRRILNAVIQNFNYLCLKIVAAIVFRISLISFLKSCALT
jgi:hypothetical protein